MIHWFVDSLHHRFVGTLIQGFIDSLVHRLISSLMFICISFVNWFIDSLIHGFINSLIHCFVDSLVSFIGISTLNRHLLIQWCTSQLQQFKARFYRPLISYSDFLFLKLPPQRVPGNFISFYCTSNRRKFKVKLPTIWTDEKQSREEAERRERLEERRVEEKEYKKKEDADAWKGRKVAKHCVYQWFGAPEGRKVGSLKRRVRSQLARWEMKKCTPLWREAHFEVKM